MENEDGGEQPQDVCHEAGVEVGAGVAVQAAQCTGKLNSFTELEVITNL